MGCFCFATLSYFMSLRSMSTKLPVIFARFGSKDTAAVAN